MCLCDLFSLMRSASLLTAPGIPRFRGAEPKRSRRLEDHPRRVDGPHRGAGGLQLREELVLALLDRVGEDAALICLWTAFTWTAAAALPPVASIGSSTKKSRSDASPGTLK